MWAPTPTACQSIANGTLLLAAAHDGTVKVLTIDGKTVKLVSQVKVGEKRMSGVSFTHDGKSAIVALRDENGASVLSVDGSTVTLTKERISTGVNPYAIDISGDGHWAVIGNTGTSRTVDDADVVTLVDVSKRPFRAVQQISVSATPEGIAISPDGHWIAVSSMAGSNLLPSDPGRHKLGTVSLFAINDGWASRSANCPAARQRRAWYSRRTARRSLSSSTSSGRSPSMPFATASSWTRASASNSPPDRCRSARCRADRARYLRKRAWAEVGVAVVGRGRDHKLYPCPLCPELDIGPAGAENCAF